MEVELGEVVTSMKNGLYKPAEEYSEDGVPTLRMYNICDGQLVWRDVTRVRLSVTEAVDYGLVEGDILVNRVNSPELVGKAAMIPAGAGPLAFESKNIRVRLIQQVNPSLVNQWLRTERARDHISEGTKQTTGMATVSQPTLASMPIRLPPWNEQHRIVAKLDDLRARSRKAREALDEVPALLDKLKQSVLAAAFRGDLTAEWRAANPDVEPASALLDRIRAERRRRWEERNPRKVYGEPEPVDAEGLPELPELWCWASVEELTEFVTSGSRGWGEFYAPTGARFLRVGNLKHDTVELDLRDLAYVRPPAGAEGTRTRVLLDDVLLSITADVGMVAHVSAELGEAYINQHVALMRPVPGVPQRCFAYSLVDPMGLQRVVRGAQYGMTKASLSLAQVRSFAVPLLPSVEAQVLSAVLDKSLHAVDAQRKVLEGASADLTSLDQSLLSKAFRGELVPQDPNDEPADVLLARIKAEAQPAKRR